jgi:RNA polymerase sigma factor (sigma-70 family)
MRPSWDLFRAILRRAAAAAADPLSDAELLARFARSRDEAAFEALLWRHAGLVLGVCRRVVRDEQLAEDAFQATFLILARKAASVRRSASVSGWLHRVARRVATRAATKRAARAVREVDLSHDPTAIERVHDGGLRLVLDAEIDRLPDRYRLPVILCYVREHSTEDAARQLGIPRGTVLSRLATARKRLAGRLTRRGVTVPAALIGFGGAAATASRPMIDSAFRAALGFAAGSTAAMPGPSILATEVLRMTAWRKAAAVVAALAVAAGVGTGLSVVASQSPGAGDGPVVQTKPGDPPAKSTPIAPPEIDKPRADQLRASRIRLIERQEVVVQNHIDRLTRTRQVRAGALADDVDARSLRTRLEQTDGRILTAEDRLARAGDEVRDAQSALGQVDQLKPSDPELLNLLRFDSSVGQAALAARQKQEVVKELVPKVGNESAVLKKAREELEAANKALGEVQKAARTEVEKQWRDNKRTDAQRRLDQAKATRQSSDTDLESQRKRRTELVQRIARARAAEEADQLAEDELRVYRELRQQLLRKRLLLQLEADGVSLPDSGASPPADDRLDRLAREIESLRAEVERLNESKTNSPAGGNVPAGRPGGPRRDRP